MVAVQPWTEKITLQINACLLSGLAKKSLISLMSGVLISEYWLVVLFMLMNKMKMKQ